MNTTQDSKIERLSTRRDVMRIGVSGAALALASQQLLGAEVQLDVVSGEQSLIARVDARTQAKRHQEIELAVNMDKIHIFEKESPNNRVKTEEQ